MSDATDEGQSTARHTPGPWQIGGIAVGRLGRNRIIEASRESKWSGSGVAEVFGVRDENCVANACLIAAAPDMLEALQHIAALQWGWEGDCGAVAIAEAAISAATADGSS